MDFQCPHCQANLQGDDDLVGQHLKCPSCGKRITVPEPDDEAGNREARAQLLASHPNLSQTDGSNVSLLVSLGIGVGIGVVWLAILFPFKGATIPDLFLARGWVPYALVLLSGWSIGILILKHVLLRRQQQALLLNVLPTALGEEIGVDNVLEFIDHVKGMPPRVQDSFMVQRMRLGLEHFFLRRSNPEVASMMMVQAEIDSGTVRSSYSLLKVFIWAIPILGFIGTVLGISAAVGGFNGDLNAAEDISVLTESLSGVTGGLALAFDTTLVALVLSLIISIPASAMQKSEEDMLGKVDAYCNNTLLKRLNDAGGLSDVALHTSSLSTALSEAMTGNQREVVEEMRAMVKQMSQVQEQMNTHAGSWSEQMQVASEALVKKGDDTWEKVGKDLTASFAHVREAVTNLNEVLGQLDGKQVQVEVKRKGLFGRK